jgi:hypothetical protein
VLEAPAARNEGRGTNAIAYGARWISTSVLMMKRASEVGRRTFPTCEGRSAEAVLASAEEL